MSVSQLGWVTPSFPPQTQTQTPFFRRFFSPCFHCPPPSHVCTVGVLGVSKTMCQRQHATYSMITVKLRHPVRIQERRKKGEGFLRPERGEVYANDDAFRTDEEEGAKKSTRRQRPAFASRLLPWLSAGKQVHSEMLYSSHRPTVVRPCRITV